MWKRPKYLRNLRESAFFMIFIILREVDFENFAPCVRWNRRSVFEDIEIRWQVSCSIFWEFATPNWNSVIWKKEKNFLIPLFHFSNLHQISNILKKKMIVIDKLFPKLQTLKIFLRILSQENRFGTGFESEHVKASQILVKSPWESFYHVLHHSHKSWFGKCLL